MLSAIGGFSGGVTNEFLTNNYYNQTNINQAYGPFAKFVNGIITPADPESLITDFSPSSGLFLPFYGLAGSTFSMTFPGGAMQIAGTGPEGNPPGTEILGVRARFKLFADANGILSYKVGFFANWSVINNVANNVWYLGPMHSDLYTNSATSRYCGYGIGMSGPGSVSHIYVSSLSMSSFSSGATKYFAQRIDTGRAAPADSPDIFTVHPSISYNPNGHGLDYLPDAWDLLWSKSGGLEAPGNDTGGGITPGGIIYPYPRGLDLSLLYITSATHVQTLRITSFQLTAGFMAISV